MRDADDPNVTKYVDKRTEAESLVLVDVIDARQPEYYSIIAVRIGISDKIKQIVRRSSSLRITDLQFPDCYRELHPLFP